MMQNATRRHFLKITSAGLVAAAVDPLAAFGAARPPVRLKIGLTSDIHISMWRGADRKFEECLRFFDREKVDGVLVAGDIADSGMLFELERTAEIWFKVFKDGKRSDGAPVANLMHFGNHCTGGYLTERAGFLKRYNLTGKPQEEIDAFKRKNLLINHRERDWEACFKEKYSCVKVVTVKGYDFVLQHFDPRGGRTGCTSEMEAFLKKEYRPKPGKPFFYSQHRVPKETCAVRGPDDGSATRVLSSLPYAKQCLAFCGHAHKSLFDERCVWQGAFSCVQIPTCRNPLMPEGGYGTEWTKEHKKDPNDTQCLVMNVYDEAIEIERRNYRSGGVYAQAWKLPAPRAGSAARASVKNRG